MSEATLTSKGQLTMPKEVRDALGVRVDFVRMEDGNFAVLPATKPVVRLRGIMKKPAKPLSLEAMDKAIASGSRGA
jgi:AbrB family looped-hinge helix DNA binding protein